MPKKIGPDWFPTVHLKFKRIDGRLILHQMWMDTTPDCNSEWRAVGIEEEPATAEPNFVDDGTGAHYTCSHSIEAAAAWQAFQRKEVQPPHPTPAEFFMCGYDRGRRDEVVFLLRKTGKDGV